MGVTIENLVTSGTFSLDGGTWDVDNNVWIVGNEDECVIIDSPHDAAAIINQVRGRKVLAILLTHAHNDHIGAAREVAEAVEAPIYLHPADLVLWEQVYPGTKPDKYLGDGDVFEVAGAALRAIHTPGHSPGSTCFLLEAKGTVFTGDTLFNGGPGAAGRSYSDYPTILASIRERLLTLPPETVVRTGHGENTTIGAERADAPVSYFLESRAASAERLRVTAELVDQHATTLETVAGALRSAALDDAASRAAATDLVGRALVSLRALSDGTTDMVEEPVAKAFERLREDLLPLTRFRGVDVQFIEPPLNGRALPGEVAHAARSIVRGLLLAMMDQPEVRRVRAQWDCDGENLLIHVRDDGGGTLSATAASMGRLERRVQALDGKMQVDVMPGWGADVCVVLPLGARQSDPPDVSNWNLGSRALEVLQHLAEGQRNRMLVPCDQ